MPWMQKCMPRQVAGGMLAMLVLAACGTPGQITEPARGVTSAPAGDVAAQATLAPSPGLVASVTEGPGTPPDAVLVQETAVPGGAPPPQPAASRSTATPAAPPPSPRAELPTPGLPRPQPPAPAITPAGTWVSYQSSTQGFTASYPAGWAATEAGGSTSFAAPEGNAQIVVRVQPIPTEPDQPPGLPTNSQCSTVLVGEAAATRCGDTVTLRRTAAIATISATPGVAAATFESFLQQFRWVPAA